jgi:hypothetical protein
VALRRDVFLLFPLVSCGVCGKRTREMMLGTHVFETHSPESLQTPESYGGIKKIVDDLSPSRALSFLTKNVCRSA